MAYKCSFARIIIFLQEKEKHPYKAQKYPQIKKNATKEKEVLNSVLNFSKLSTFFYWNCT